MPNTDGELSGPADLHSNLKVGPFGYCAGSDGRVDQIALSGSAAGGGVAPRPPPAADVASKGACGWQPGQAAIFGCWRPAEAAEVSAAAGAGAAVEGTAGTARGNIPAPAWRVPSTERVQ